MSSFFSFATTRRFAPLFGTQFLGAFNDNLFKTAFFVLISYYGLGQNTILPASQMLNLGALLFVLPYFLFSALAGQLATRFNKARLAQGVKILEVCIMLLAMYGFCTHTSWILFLSIFMMGLHSTLFGPIKYAILPEYLSQEELLMGNGLVESGTFLAILLGQILGTIMAGTPMFMLGLAVLLVAIMGLGFSLWMPSVPPQKMDTKVDWHFARSTYLLMRQTWAQKNLTTAIIGISWFWFIGSVYTTQLPTFVQKHLGGNDNVFNLMLTLFSIGIATGSVFCARISKGRLHLGWVLIGSLGLSICGSLLVLFAHQLPMTQEQQGILAFLNLDGAYSIIVLMIAIGFFGGFFSVPLYTWLQTESDDSFRAQAVAANNIVNAIFMLVAALLSALLLSVFDSILLLYFLVALGNIPLIIYLIHREKSMLDDIKTLF